MISLIEFCAQYFTGRRVSPVYAATVKRRAKAVQIHAGESAIDRVLRESVVNDFLCSLTLSPYTVRSYRSDILSLWNGAADRDLVPYPVMRRIFTPDAPDLLVECYTIDEVRAILKAAEKIKGGYPNGVAKRHYWPGAIRLAWDAGLRRGDVWKFRRDMVRPDGTLRTIQSKTRQVVTVRLHQSTVEAIAKIKINYPLQWPLDPSFFGRHFRSLLNHAGVERGSFKWLRRSSGSYVEMQQPGSGHKQLGHSSPQIFNRHYDAKLGGATWPMVPEL